MFGGPPADPEDDGGKKKRKAKKKVKSKKKKYKMVYVAGEAPPDDSGSYDGPPLADFLETGTGGALNPPRYELPDDANADLGSVAGTPNFGRNADLAKRFAEADGNVNAILDFEPPKDGDIKKPSTPEGF